MNYQQMKELGKLPAIPYSEMTDTERFLSVRCGNLEQSYDDFCRVLLEKGREIDQLKHELEQLSWRSTLRDITEPHVKLILGSVIIVACILALIFGSLNLVEVLRILRCG